MPAEIKQLQIHVSDGDLDDIQVANSVTWIFPLRC